MNGIFILHPDVQILFRLSCRVLRDLILGFFVGGESGEEGGVVGRMMIGVGVFSAVCGLRWCLMVVDAVVCSVWTAGGNVSFSGVGCRRAGVDLVVGVGLVAAVGCRGHSPAEGAGCLPLSSPSCCIYSW